MQRPVASTKNEYRAMQCTRQPSLCSGSEAGSYLRLIDSCINQLQAQGPSRTCNESKGEEETTPPRI